MYLRYTPEIYKTQALLQVAIKDQPSEFSNFYSFNSNTNLNGEIALIKSEKSISKLIEKLDLNIFYFNEGEILTRFLYNSNSFKLENYSLKNPKLKSEKLYLSFDGSYFSLKNENSAIVYAEYIEPNKFFSSKYLSGIIKPLNSPDELKKTIQSSKSL